MKWYPPKRKSQERDPSDPFVVTQVWVPKSLNDKLDEASERLKIPKSRLLVYALDNELDAASPFYYPCPMPTTPYVEYAYSEEAGRLMRYLPRFQGGASADTLVVCRRAFDIESRAVVMLALRELIEVGLVEEFTPARSKRGPEHTRFRIKNVGAIR